MGSGKEFGARFHYTLQDEAGGIAHALSLVNGFVNDDNITVILGDNIILDDISEYVSNFTSGARIFLKEVKDPQRFGVPEFDENQRIKRIEEKPKEKYGLKFSENSDVSEVFIDDITLFIRILFQRQGRL